MYLKKIINIFFIILSNILRHNYQCLCFPWLENPEKLRQVGSFLPLRSAIDSSKMKTSLLADNLPLYLYFIRKRKTNIVHTKRNC